MPQHHSGADANDEPNTCDYGEGGEDAAPDAPLRAKESQEPSEFIDRESRRHTVPASQVNCG
jgi:hypothetical protein